MDIKTFAEDDFDPKKWINKVWGSSGNQEKEVFLANAVTRLQLYMKQLTNSLDETTTQIVTSVPRILQDASSLQLEGALLQQKLVSLEQMVRDVEEQTGHSIESLQRIDYLKGRLENAAATLREADKWTALAIGLEEVLESGVPTEPDKLAELAKQVAAMTASLEVLSEAPDYETKRAQLETLYNKLEAAITPPLIAALTQMDANRSAVYVTLFASMSRLVPACRCWRRAAAARLAAAWRRLEAPKLDALTSTLAKEAPKQVEWLTNVLKTDAPLAELIRLYTDLLLSLDPSPTKVVSANLKLCSTPEEGLLMLTDLRSDIDEFVRSIKAILDAPRQNKETVAPATMREFYRAVYAPLRELLPRYCELQTQLLLAHLDEPQLKQEDLLEHARAILSVSERCEGWLAAAYSRCSKIGGAAAYNHYVTAVESLISALCLLISTSGRHLEAQMSSPAESGGVLSNNFPAALLLETAAALLLDTVAARHEAEAKDEVSEWESPIVAALQDSAETRADAGRRTAPLRRARAQLRALGRAVLRRPVDRQLDKILGLGVWTNNDALSTDLPDFAFPPQEYITEIGQYLMTLPQHLEMHIAEKQAPWQLLSEVCTHTCDMYAEKILNIRNMDALGTKRCLTDIVYLSSVVEDLGSSVTPALKNLERSLRAATPAQETA